jgi:hypothetical protein
MTDDKMTLWDGTEVPLKPYPAGKPSRYELQTKLPEMPAGFLSAMEELNQPLCPRCWAAAGRRATARVVALYLVLPALVAVGGSLLWWLL